MLKLVRTPEPPEGRPLTPARSRLAAVLAECRKAAALRERIEQARHELAQATEAEANVHKRLDDLMREERAEWDQWAQAGGSDARPSPRTSQREALSLELADASTLRAQAEQALDALLRGNEGAFSEHAAALARRLDAAIADVLVEEALILSERRDQLIQQEMVLAAAVATIRDKLAAMRTAESWAAQSRITDMLRMTVGRLDQLGQAIEPRRREIGEAYASLAARLRDDALAKVREEPPQPEPGDSA